MPVAAGSGHGADGASLVEVLLTLAVAALMLGIAVPLTAHTVDASTGNQAAHLLASRLRWARQHAVIATTSTAMVFSQQNGRWVFEMCVDGNGNGVRRTEIAAGTDHCLDGPADLQQLFTGAAVSVDPALPGPEGDPGTSDPVMFGHSDMASFSPAGSGTGGTVFVRSAKGVQYAIRVGNMTGRTRVLRYDPGTRKWGSG